MDNLSYSTKQIVLCARDSPVVDTLIANVVYLYFPGEGDISPLELMS